MSDNTHSTNNSPTTTPSPISFSRSIEICFSKYVDFKGRASRPEFWWFFLFSMILSWGAAWLGLKIVATVVYLVLFLPMLAVGTRRLHDTNKTGWWQLLYLLPILGSIVLLIFFAMEGKGPNDYDEVTENVTE